MPNFKSKAAYKAWLAYGHASGEFEKTPGNQPVSIKGKSHKVKHPGGGKLGDTLKLTGDTLLSTIGLSDVIGDENYRNQGFADASRVGEKIGQQAGQIAGNLLLPGMGGQIVSTAQNTLGNLDGTDEERARIEQMRLNKDSYGKYSDSITDMNKMINPLSTGVTVAGTLGNIGATNFMQTGSVLGDLSGLKNSFGQGIFGNTSQPVGDASGSAMSALSGLPMVSGDINYGIQTDINKLNNPSANPMGIQDALSRSGLNAFGGNMNKKKYPNGGPITMNEQVVPGSARHKELLKMQSDYQNQKGIYDKQQAYFQGLGITPTTLTADQFSSKYGELDSSYIPEGSVIYDYGKASIEGTPPSGMVSFSHGPTGDKQFLAGAPAPTEVPAYDLAPEDTIDMTIQPEKIFAPIEAGVYNQASGNPTTKTVGYSYGYEGQKPESITTVDPYSRERLFRPNSQSFTSGMFNSDFGTIANSLEGVPIQDYATRQQMLAKTSEPIVGQFAYGGNLNMLPDGGKFIEYQGPDHANGGINVDTNGVPTPMQTSNEVEGGETLHDNGIENYIFSDRLVVNPGDKKKLTFADLSKKINNKYKNSDKDPIAEKTRKLELENLKGEQESLKQMMNGGEDFACGGKMKHPDGGPIKSRTDSNQPASKESYPYTYKYNAINRQDQSLVDYLDGRDAEHTSNYDKYSSILPTLRQEQIRFETGRYDTNWYPDVLEDFYIKQRLKNKYPDGGRLPQDADPYYYSDPIIPALVRTDQLSGREDANQSISTTGNAIARKYGFDEYANNNRQTNPDLFGTKLSKGVIPYNYQQRFATGGGLPILDPNAPYGIAGLDTALGMLSSANPSDLLGATTNDFDPNQSLVSGLATKSEHWDKRPLGSGILKSDPNAQPQSEGSGLPQDTINPLGYFASNIGNIYDLTQASKETPKNKFGRANFETVDYSAARTEAEKQAAIGRAIARENARNSTSAGGGMTNRVIANALISSGLGSQLGQSYMQEANANAQIKNQENQINTNITMQERIADQQDLAKRLSTTSQALHGIGMNTQGFVRDLKSAEIGNINNQMWFDMVKSGKYTEIVPTSNGQFKTGIRIGNKIIDPNTREVIITYKEGDAEYIKPTAGN